MEIRYGVTRIVILTKKWAIKIPRLYFKEYRSWWWFLLQGLSSNLHEDYWWRDTKGDVRLCPVKFADPIGCILVMPTTQDIDYLPAETDFMGLPLDHKVENFGLLNGQVVLRDYGS